MHISVAHQQLHVGDVVDVLKEAVELIEATRLGPIQREATELCPKLGQTHTKRKKQDECIGQELDLLHLLHLQECVGVPPRLRLSNNK